MPGESGPQGMPGNGSGTPSVSAVTPASAYLSRTVDLSIAGNGTNWSSSTTVAFADPKVTVNKLTAASPTGLLVNVTIGADATIGATDVTVSDGGTTETYKGAFQIKSPLAVTLTPTAGLVQGGFASLHLQMLDIATPFDPANLKVAFSRTDVSLEGQPAASGLYGMDFQVRADAMASSTGGIDVVVTSGPTGASIDSPAKGVITVTARTATALTAGTDAAGMIATSLDSSLYRFTPAAAAVRFLQYTASSPDSGGLIAFMLPKSGAYADVLGAFSVRFGLGVTSTDPMYVVLTDGGTGATAPYHFDLKVTETPATAVTFSGTHTDATTALALATLPALVDGDLGAVPTTTGDWYKFTVAANTTVHFATGGDGLSAVSLNLLDVDGATWLGSDAGGDHHKDLVNYFNAAGTYYVQVIKDAYGLFDAAHSKYQLFVEKN
jgi:hypothetical protein